MSQDIGKILFVLGTALLAVGIILYFFGNKLGWVGNLPGDIRIEKGNTRLYFPITTMIIASLLLSLIIRIIK
jgi:hypothetical protein